MSKAAMNNRANQMNPNNRAYYGSRGVPAPICGSWQSDPCRPAGTPARPGDEAEAGGTAKAGEQAQK